jgi:hypothetical protein
MTRRCSPTYFSDSLNAGKAAARAVAVVVANGWATDASLETCERYADGPTGWNAGEWMRGYRMALDMRGYLHLVR